MNSTKEYVEAMDQMDTTLKEADKIYFNNLREYMQTNIFFKDEDSINRQIYQMYLDFMSAKEDGFTAEEFFGSNPKEMADEILKELPNASPINISKYVGIFAIVLWGIRLFYDFMENVHITINPAIYLFDLVLIMSLVFIFLRIINKNIFREPKFSDMNKIEILVVLLLLLISIFLYFSVPELIPNTLEIAVIYPWDIILVICYVLITGVVMLRLKIKDLYNTLLTLIVFAFIGIELRLIVHNSMKVPIIPLKYRLIILGSFFILKYILKKRGLKKM